jgi:hypothetical protein
MNEDKRQEAWAKRCEESGLYPWMDGYDEAKEEWDKGYDAGLANSSPEVEEAYEPHVCPNCKRVETAYGGWYRRDDGILICSSCGEPNYSLQI